MLKYMNNCISKISKRQINFILEAFEIKNKTMAKSKGKRNHTWESQSTLEVRGDGNGDGKVTQFSSVFF